MNSITSSNSTQYWFISGLNAEATYWTLLFSQRSPSPSVSTIENYLLLESNIGTMELRWRSFGRIHPLSLTQLSSSEWYCLDGGSEAVFGTPPIEVNTSSGSLIIQTWREISLFHSKAHSRSWFQMFRKIEESLAFEKSLWTEREDNLEVKSTSSQSGL